MLTRTDRRRCQEHILARLRQEMSKRGDDLGIGWIERERFVVAVAANEWAQAHRGRLVTVDDVEGVERLAVGHVDYASKLALYVAELVIPSELFEWQGRVSPDA